MRRTEARTERKEPRRTDLRVRKEVETFSEQDGAREMRSSGQCFSCGHRERGIDNYRATFLGRPPFAPFARAAAAFARLLELPAKRASSLNRSA